jgi:cytochrome P450
MANPGSDVSTAPTATGQGPPGLVVPVVDFDHHSPAFAADPLGTAAPLRDSPLSWSDAVGGFYAVGGYEAVRRAALDPATLTQARDADDPIKLGAQVPPSEFGLIVPSEADAPAHTAYRRALAPFFTAKAAKEREARLRHWTGVCLDEVVETGRIDFVTDLTGPVAFIFFCEMIGLPLDDWRRWQEPIHALMANPPGSPEAIQALLDEDENTQTMMAIAAERREDPRDDMISALACSAHPDGTPFTPREVTAACKNVMLGAVDSVGGLVSHALLYLHQNPEERRRLQEDPSLVPGAVEEFLRYFSPGTTTARTVGAPTTLHGQPVEAGDRVLLVWMAANHDPEAFDRPDEVVLDRSPNKHLAFGAGIHKCIGLQFARLEAQVFIEQVLERLPDFDIVDPDVVPMPSIGLFRGFWNVPATFTPGTKVQAERRPG